MAAPGADLEEARRRLFRRLRWFFVYLPPFLLALVLAGGGALLAWLVRWEGSTFAERWLLAVILVGALGTALHALRSRLENRR